VGPPTFGRARMRLSERIRENVPCRWAVRFAVKGDLRFCSHRDMMRAIERTAVRAGLDLAYSQGFNPHPLISLTCPRPVGVASDDDLLVFWLNEPCLQTPASLTEALNAHCPPGMRFFHARPLPRGPCPQVRRIRYELPLAAGRAEALASLIEQLRQVNAWPVQRADKGEPERNGRPKAVRTINLKPLVASLALEPDRLTFVLHAGGGQSARPAELLTLLDMDVQDTSRLVRAAVDYEMPPAP